MDLSFFVGSKLDSSGDKKTNAIRKETLIFDPNDKYTQWLIPKFTPITKRARFTPEPLAILIIVDDMTSVEKEVFTKMLYNWETVLAWDFSNGKSKKKVATPQKI